MIIRFTGCSKTLHSRQEQSAMCCRLLRPSQAPSAAGLCACHLLPICHYAVAKAGCNVRKRRVVATITGHQSMHGVLLPTARLGGCKQVPPDQSVSDL